MITITCGASRFCDTGRGPWGRGVQGGYTLPEGASEGVWGWEPHTFFCENCIDSILSEQHSKINKTLETILPVAAASTICCTNMVKNKVG